MEVDQKNMDYLKLHRIINSVLGLPAQVYAEVRSFSVPATFLWFLYVHLSEVILLFGLLGHIFALTVVWRDMSLLCGCLASGSHALQVFAKTIFLHVKKQKLLDHLERHDRRITPDFLRFYYEKSKYVRVYLIVYLSLMFTSSSLYFLPYVYNCTANSDQIENQHFPLVVHYFTTSNTTPTFQIATVVLTICFYFVNLKTIAINSCILNLVVMHSAGYRYHMKQLNDILVLYNESDHKSDSFKSLSRKSVMKSWISQHQELLQIADNFQNIMSPFLAMEFVYVFVHTCVPAFVITSTSTWTLTQKVVVFFIAGGTLVELFLLSRAGDEFTEAYGEVAKPLFQSRLFDKENGWSRNVFTMVRMRLRRPFRLTASKTFPLCNDTFLKILKLVLTYYMTLNELQKHKENH